MVAKLDMELMGVFILHRKPIIVKLSLVFKRTTVVIHIWKLRAPLVFV